MVREGLSPATSLVAIIARDSHEFHVEGLSNPDGLERVRIASRASASIAFVGHLYGLASGIDPALYALEAFESYGRYGLDILDGRYATVIVREAEVILATDHAGTVPLYYTVHNGSLVVATRLLDISKIRELRMRSFEECQAGIPRMETFLHDVHRVPVGTIVRLERRNMNVTSQIRYWSAVQRIKYNDARSVEVMVRDALKRAYSLRRDLFSGLTQGLLLSGGIDSSALAASACAAGDDVQTFSIGTSDNNEFHHAQNVARHLGTSHSEILFAHDDLIHVIPYVVSVLEGVQSEFVEYTTPLFILYSKLRDIEVVHTGYGSDMMFAGIYEGAARWKDIHQHCIDEVAIVDSSNELSANIGWFFGIETEHAYFDRNFLELAMAINPSLKMVGDTTKYILRRAFEDLLPSETVWRPKLGVHDSTGVRSAFSALVPAAGDKKKGKDQLVYLIGEEMFCKRIKPGDVDIHRIAATANSLTH